MVANNVFPIYHVSKLKLANTSTLHLSPEPTTLPSEILEQPTREYHVQSILKRQVNKGKKQYRIRWGLPYDPADELGRRHGHQKMRSIGRFLSFRKGGK